MRAAADEEDQEELDADADADADADEDAADLAAEVASECAAAARWRLSATASITARTTVVMPARTPPRASIGLDCHTRCSLCPRPRRLRPTAGIPRAAHVRASKTTAAVARETKLCNPCFSPLLCDDA